MGSDVGVGHDPGPARLRPALTYPRPGVVERPAGTELLAFEGEIALVIGTAARRVSTSEAWAHVAHVTASNDLGLYDLLLQVAPSPSARLARAVAVAEDSGTAAGLTALEGIEIADSHRPAAVRAELLARAGDVDAARAAYDQAIAACRNAVEREFLVGQRAALASD